MSRFPDFCNLTVEVAQARAEDLGLVVEWKKYSAFPWTKKEYVADQSIKEGKKVEVGTTIILYYYS